MKTTAWLMRFGLLAAGVLWLMGPYHSVTVRNWAWHVNRECRRLDIGPQRLIV